MPFCKSGAYRINNSPLVPNDFKTLATGSKLFADVSISYASVVSVASAAGASSAGAD